MLVRGAHGAFSGLTTKSTVRASSNFYRDQEKPGMYVSEFKGPCSGFVRGTRTGQRRGSYIHVVIAGIRTPAATEHAPERRLKDADHPATVRRLAYSSLLTSVRY